MCYFEMDKYYLNIIIKLPVEDFWFVKCENSKGDQIVNPTTAILAAFFLFFYKYLTIMVSSQNRHF